MSGWCSLEKLLCAQLPLQIDRVEGIDLRNNQNKIITKCNFLFELVTHMWSCHHSVKLFEMFALGSLAQIKLGRLCSFGN